MVFVHEMNHLLRIIHWMMPAQVAGARLWIVCRSAQLKNPSVYPMSNQRLLIRPALQRATLLISGKITEYC